MNPRGAQIAVGLAMWAALVGVAALIFWAVTSGDDEDQEAAVSQVEPTPGEGVVGDAASLRERARAAGLTVLPAVQALNPEQVELGALLFFDRRLSGDGSLSCASCHNPALGWGDGNEISIGYPGSLHWRNSQTVINSAFLSKWFWAGESLSLEAQAKSAITGVLAGNLDASLAEERLRQVPEYVERFRDVYGTNGPQWPDILTAIAVFEATIISTNVPFDRWLDGDDSALSAQQREGLELFLGRAGCAQCHSGPLLTDESMHAQGVPRNTAFDEDPLRQIALRWQVLARGVSEEEFRTATEDLGLFYTTKEEADKGKFRTPPLREVAVTGPFMHNGVFRTLDEVLRFYNAGGGEGLNTSPLLQPLGLNDDEIDVLAAFLQALSGDPVFVEAPQPPSYGTFPLSGN